MKGIIETLKLLKKLLRYMLKIENSPDLRLLRLAAVIIAACFYGGQSLRAEPIAWSSQGVVFSAGEAGSFDETAVKDPSIVYYRGYWHLFYTSRGRERYGLGYARAGSIEELQVASRYDLSYLDTAYCAAPQVFYFEPQKMWYLIYQNRGGNYLPVYSTNRDLFAHRKWSTSRALIENNDNRRKIDFWIICDSLEAHLFYADNDSKIYRMSTGLDSFPKGFSGPEIAVELRRQSYEVHEAAHVYTLEGPDGYLMIAECIRPGEEGYIQRFITALRATELTGGWHPVSDLKDGVFADEKNVFFGRNRWTFNLSHPELIRTNYNQTPQVDPQKMRMMVQGLPPETKIMPYPQYPWCLGIISVK